MPGWCQRFIIALLLAFLLTGTFVLSRPVHAQDSPLPRPTPGAVGQTSQPVSNTVAVTAAPSSLAGTALISPGAVAMFVLVVLVVVGGVARYRQRS